MRTRLPKETQDRLRGVPLFRTYSDRELAQVDLLLDDVHVDPGEVLAREGQWGRQTFIVVSGEAEITMHGERIRILEPGATFGELDRFEIEPWSGTLTALTPMHLLVVGPKAFPTYLEQRGVAKGILREMAARARRHP